MSKKWSSVFQEKINGVTPQNWQAETVMTKKSSPVLSGKNRGVSPSVAAPGVTHPSDATGATRDYGTSGPLPRWSLRLYRPTEARTTGVSVSV